ncbi:hypothetical protein NUU61_009202 [Penicillium alfredii]|uniref:Putative gamma-glutamylcyclotransferase n=1 Tax=Penicillium alfredii TaxID=1506179 RepID=A0A9W9EMK3_9EURO|nr:uncharacterized protein NUU61_009202 [Penicillium alfredii]KAJ5084623.1 hypothetical protein NUU61_009202 [Penicillium alfredii]
MSDSAPPPPPPPAHPESKISPAVRKLRSTPPEKFFPIINNAPIDPSDLPTGPYFFYGSLLDPGILGEILGLDTKPELRPAYIEGYQCKLWGQYPALVGSVPSDIVKGAVYNVRSVAEAAKLAAYETRNYQPVSCAITYTDGIWPAQQPGSAFLFRNPRDLSEGCFDLKVWLKRVGRDAASDQLEGKKMDKSELFSSKSDCVWTLHQ